MTANGSYDIELNDVPLRLEAVLRGEQAGGELSSRLSYGTKVAGFDPELAPAKEWERLIGAGGPAGRFRHLTVACSFFPETPDEPGEFVKAQLGLQFRGHSKRPSVARAIHPLRQKSPTYPAPTRKITLQTRLGVIKATGEQQWTAGDNEEWAILGFGLLQPTPSWRFQPTARDPLVGVCQVDVLVELGDGDSPVADVLLSAQVRRRGRLGRYLAELNASEREMPLS